MPAKDGWIEFERPYLENGWSMKMLDFYAKTSGLHVHFFYYI